MRTAFAGLNNKEIDMAPTSDVKSENDETILWTDELDAMIPFSQFGVEDKMVYAKFYDAFDDRRFYLTAGGYTCCDGVVDYDVYGFEIMPSQKIQEWTRFSLSRLQTSDRVRRDMTFVAKPFSAVCEDEGIDFNAHWNGDE